MNPQDARSPSTDALPDPLHPGRVRAMLADCVDWPADKTPRDIVIERCWPDRVGGITVEWSFKLPGDGTRTLFGTTGSSGRPPSPCSARAVADFTDATRGVCVDAPGWNMQVHSPDCDEKLPHLARCLDGHAMAERLAPVRARLNGGTPVSVGHVQCRLLAYRPGRRAAIEFRPEGSGGIVLIGKTYADGRGEDLARLHEELNRQIGWQSDRRVRVPVVVDYLPDLNMILFGHVRGRALTYTEGRAEDAAGRAIDAVSALHRCRIDALPAFTVSHECGILSRWHVLLGRMHPPMARRTRSLVDSLLGRSALVERGTWCVAHRDFYEQQLILGRRTTTILDLDTLALAHPCVDLGNFLAHLFLAGAALGWETTRFDAIAEHAIRRYRFEGRAVDPRALSFYTASALFRVGAVHALRTRTCRFAPALWALAEQVAADGDRDWSRRRFRFLNPEKPHRLPPGEVRPPAFAVETLS
ncbi:MAG: hypothetical protein ACE5E1_00600 [Phycisphaerae bacterium]